MRIRWLLFLKYDVFFRFSMGTDSQTFVCLYRCGKEQCPYVLYCRRRDTLDTISVIISYLLYWGCIELCYCSRILVECCSVYYSVCRLGSFRALGSVGTFVIMFERSLGKEKH
jgi:hypothetical protein